jgi:o-succinylbenzoate---CoA ligase
VRLDPIELSDSSPAHVVARLRQALADDRDPIALVLATSGTTGPAKRVLLPTAALLAAAQASHDRLGGPGHWLAALPLTHIGGLQVVVRAIHAGTEPVVLDVRGGFDAAAFAGSVETLAGRSGRRYTSLVPTQLVRVLDLAAASLAALDAVLIGGAPASPALLARARGLGINVVNSYGMTETCGGVVYDGVPLPGVLVAIGDDGRISLGGPVVADGYDGPGAGFSVSEGNRWFRTNDLGQLADGQLQVLGRADDVLISGGVNVLPAAVEAVVSALPGVRECVVVGVPDSHWGQRIEALIVGEPPTLVEIRATVHRQLGAAAAPKAIHIVDAIPTRGPGKPDRAAAVRLAERSGPAIVKDLQR